MLEIILGLDIGMIILLLYLKLGEIWIIKHKEKSSVDSTYYQKYLMHKLFNK